MDLPVLPPGSNADDVGGGGFEFDAADFSLFPLIAGEVLTTHERWVNLTQSVSQLIGDFSRLDFLRDLLEFALGQSLREDLPTVLAFHPSQDRLLDTGVIPVAGRAEILADVFVPPNTAAPASTGVGGIQNHKAAQGDPHDGDLFHFSAVRAISCNTARSAGVPAGSKPKAFSRAMSACRCVSMRARSPVFAATT